MKISRKTFLSIAIAAVVSTATMTAVYAHGGFTGKQNRMANPNQMMGNMQGHPQMMGNQNGMGNPNQMMGNMQGHPHMMGNQNGMGNMQGHEQMMGNMQGHPQMMGGTSKAFMQKNLDSYEQVLGITSAQEDLWMNFVNAVKGNMNAMAGMQSDANAEEPIGFMTHFDQLKMRAKQMEAVATAANALYEVLTPEQQETADRHASVVNTAL